MSEVDSGGVLSDYEYGSSARIKVSLLLEQRLEINRKSIETAVEIETIRKLQGRIAEIKTLIEFIEASNPNNKKQRSHE